MRGGRGRSIRGRLTLLTLLALAGGGGWLIPGAAGCRAPDVAADPSPRACAECHAEVVAEWEGSAHARAWSAPGFQAALQAEAAPEACAGCHAPDLVLAGAPAPPSPRAGDRGQGVDCRACHLGPDGALAGPRGADPERVLPAHPVRKDYFLYRTSQLCGTCHRATLTETERWGPELGGVQPRCQECHMPEVTRALTQSEGLGERIEAARAGAVRQHRHGFGQAASGPWGRSPVEVAWQLPDAGSGRAQVSLTLRVPHPLPTGEVDQGRYRAWLLARAADGQELARVERALARADGSALTPGQALTLELALPPEAVQLELELRREAPAPRPVLQVTRALR